MTYGQPSETKPTFGAAREGVCGIRMVRRVAAIGQ
jgi:hypothetical protein